MLKFVRNNYPIVVGNAVFALEVTLVVAFIPQYILVYAAVCGIRALAAIASGTMAAEMKRLNLDG